MVGDVYGAIPAPRPGHSNLPVSGSPDLAVTHRTSRVSRS